MPLTVLRGSMSGLSRAMVMQLRKIKTSTTWSNILWAMTFWHIIRNLEEGGENRSFRSLGQEEATPQNPSADVPPAPAQLVRRHLHRLDYH